MTRLLGWALLMLFTGLATMWLRGVVDPLLPADDWHGMLSGLFVAVTWPSLTWSLRRYFASSIILPSCFRCLGRCDAAGSSTRSATGNVRASSSHAMISSRPTSPAD